jgi:hypothetical protein
MVVDVFTAAGRRDESAGVPGAGGEYEGPVREVPAAGLADRGLLTGRETAQVMAGRADGQGEGSGRSCTSAIPGLVMQRITLPRQGRPPTVDATMWLLYGGNRQVATCGGGKLTTEKKETTNDQSQVRNT